MKIVKMGVIGLGTWGTNHIKIYQSHPFADVVAICDSNEERLKSVSSKFGINDIYTDYNDMLEHSKCDAVAIVTPDFAHADICVAACKKGKHILLEKPLATTRDEVFIIADVVEKYGVRAMVDFHNRWNPPFNEAHQLIQKGEIGTIQSAYFRLNDIKWVATNLLPWASKSSILWFLGSHSFDTLQWLFNDRIERVYSVCTKGILQKSGVAVEDQYLTTLEFKNGGIAHMENGWITPNLNPCINDIQFSILGSKGMININASSNSLIQLITEDRIVNPDVMVQNSVFGNPKGFAFESIKSFIDCLVDGVPFKIDFKDSVNTSLGILAIMESAKKRIPIEVTY